MRILVIVSLFLVDSSSWAQSFPGFYVDRDECNNDYAAILEVLNRVRSTPTQNMTLDFVQEGKNLEIHIEPLDPGVAVMKRIRVFSDGEKVEVAVDRKDEKESATPLELEKRSAQDFFGPLLEVIAHSRYSERDGLLIEPCAPGRCVGASTFVASEDEEKIEAPEEQQYRIRILDGKTKDELINFSLADGVLARRRSILEHQKTKEGAKVSARANRSKICLQFGNADLCPVEHRVESSAEDLGRAELDTESADFKRLEQQFGQLVQRVSQVARKALEHENLPTTPARPVRTKP